MEIDATTAEKKLRMLAPSSSTLVVFSFLPILSTHLQVRSTNTIISKTDPPEYRQDGEA
jgi:hypothetical protein